MGKSFDSITKLAPIDCSCFYAETRVQPEWIEQGNCEFERFCKLVIRPEDWNCVVWCCLDLFFLVVFIFRFIFIVLGVRKIQLVQYNGDFLECSSCCILPVVASSLALHITKSTMLFVTRSHTDDRQVKYPEIIMACGIYYMMEPALTWHRRFSNKKIHWNLYSYATYIVTKAAFLASSLKPHGITSFSLLRGN